jgi:hypothetical protein
MSPEQSHVFELLDRYAKDHYKYFVAEMDLNQSRSRYAVCFRPLAENDSDPDPYLCRYLYIDAEEVNAAHEQGTLTTAILADLCDKISKTGNSEK